MPRPIPKTDPASLAICDRAAEWAEKAVDAPGDWFDAQPRTPRDAPPLSLPFSEQDRIHLAECETCLEAARTALHGRWWLRHFACPETRLAGDWLLDLVADPELETHLRECAFCREAAIEHARRYLGANLIDEAVYHRKLAALAPPSAPGEKVIRFPFLQTNRLLQIAASWAVALLPLGYALVTAGTRSRHAGRAKSAPASSEAAVRAQLASELCAKLTGEGIEIEFSTPPREGLWIFAKQTNADARSKNPRLTLTARRAGETIFSIASKKSGELQVTEDDFARMAQVGAEEIVLSLDEP